MGPTFLPYSLRVRTYWRGGDGTVPVVLAAKVAVLVLNFSHGCLVRRLEILELRLRVRQLRVGRVHPALEVDYLLLPIAPPNVTLPARGATAPSCTRRAFGAAHTHAFQLRGRCA